MKTCTYCGTPLGADDIFCGRCGRRINEYEKTGCAAPFKEKRERKLWCELAYTGTLFWLPLLACPDSKRARYHANQGLWLLILSVASCTAIRLLSALKVLFAGGVIGAVFGSIYSLAFIVFLFGMLFLFASALARVREIHRGIPERTILFFEKAAIIK